MTAPIRVLRSLPTAKLPFTRAATLGVVVLLLLDDGHARPLQ
ncbi:MAG: hypothetical protein WBV39_01540 [Rudaea sp.]